MQREFMLEEKHVGVKC